MTHHGYGIRAGGGYGPLLAHALAIARRSAGGISGRRTLLRRRMVRHWTTLVWRKVVGLWGRLLLEVEPNRIRLDLRVTAPLKLVHRAPYRSSSMRFAGASERLISGVETAVSAPPLDVQTALAMPTNIRLAIFAVAGASVPPCKLAVQPFSAIRRLEPFNRCPSNYRNWRNPAVTSRSALRPEPDLRPMTASRRLLPVATTRDVLDGFRLIADRPDPLGDRLITNPEKPFGPRRCSSLRAPQVAMQLALTTGP